MPLSLMRAETIPPFVALQNGLLEPREMPHDETLYIMQLMDGLRQKWGVYYPMDEY